MAIVEKMLADGSCAVVSGLGDNIIADGVGYGIR